MKRIICYEGVCLLLLLLFSCTSEFEKDAVESGKIDDIIMQTTGFRVESSSRTYPSITDGYVDVLWSEDDVVGVFPDNGSQVAFPMNSAAGKTQASFNGGGWALKPLSKYAAYYPFEHDNKDYTKIPVSYLGQKQIGKNTSRHTGAYNYMVASATSPIDGKANFIFKNMGSMVIMQLVVPEPTTLNRVVLSADGVRFAIRGEMDIMAATPMITPVTYSDELRIELENFTTETENETVTIYFMTAPVNLSGRNVTVQVYDNKGNLQKTSIAGKNLQAGGFYALNGTLPAVNIPSDVNNLTIATADANSLTPLSVSLSAVYDGFDDIIGKAWKFGVCYGTSNNPNIADAVQYASGISDGTYSYSINIEPNTTYYYRSVAYYDGAYYYGEVKSFTSPNLATDFQAVDLGLSVKWASCNLGALTADESGDYYAWGETSTKSEYTLDNYVHYDSQMDAYINLGSDISQTSYDAAYVQLGEKWRMPTYQEVSELVTSCTWLEAFYKGHAGYLVKGNNDNYIFVKTVSCTDTSSSKMAYSQFWSSTLSNEYDDLNTNNYAHYLNFSCFGVENTYMACSSFKYYGLPIRPVCDY